MPYCVKCKKKSKCSGMKLSHDSRGKPRYEGKCVSCGTRCFRYTSHVHSSVRSSKRKSKSPKRSKKSKKGTKRSKKSKRGPKSYEPVSPMYL